MTDCQEQIVSKIKANIFNNYLVESWTLMLKKFSTLNVSFAFI